MQSKVCDTDCSCLRILALCVTGLRALSIALGQALTCHAKSIKKALAAAGLGNVSLCQATSEITGEFTILFGYQILFEF